MKFKSFADLAADIARNMHRVPRSIDLVVGVPRSGVVPAATIALNLNVRYCDLGGFLANEPLKSGQTRSPRGASFAHPQDTTSILIVDDSVLSGATMDHVRELVAATGYRGSASYCSIYGTTESAKRMDLCFEIVEPPRTFQWNLFYRPLLEQCCVDIDGVLCHDPSDRENDDGPGYLHFIRTVPANVRPSHRIGRLVTSRLEKYRSETVDWLFRNGIEFDELHMLDLPSALERVRRKAHASFKSEVYAASPNAVLFVESAAWQAKEIFLRTGRPVLDFGNLRMISDTDGVSPAVVNATRLRLRVRRKLRKLLAGIGLPAVRSSERFNQ